MTWNESPHNTRYPSVRILYSFELSRSIKKLIAEPRSSAKGPQGGQRRNRYPVREQGLEIRKLWGDRRTSPAYLQGDEADRARLSTEVWGKRTRDASWNKVSSAWISEIHWEFLNFWTLLKNFALWFFFLIYFVF